MSGRWASHLPRGRLSLSLRDYAETGWRLAFALDDRDAGASTRRLEEALARECGRKRAIVTGSGKASLLLSLATLPLPPASRIVLPAFLVPEVAAAILGAGHVPVLVDVDPATFGPSPRQVRRALEGGARAVLAAHLFGTPCDIGPLAEMAREHGALLIEDAAQAIGASFAGRPVGGFGDLSYASFGLFKNVYALFGGVILTDDEDLAQRVRALRAELPPMSRGALAREWLRWGVLGLATNPAVFSWTIWPGLQTLEWLRPGIGVAVAHRPEPEYAAGALHAGRHLRRFTDAQARLASRQLAQSGAATRVRVRNAAVLDAALEGIPGVHRQRLPAGATSIRLNYVVCVSRRERVLPALRRATGLDLAPGYLSDLGSLPALGASAGDTPVAKWVQRSHFYVPVHTPLADRQVQSLAVALRGAVMDDGGPPPGRV